MLQQSSKKYPLHIWNGPVAEAAFSQRQKVSGNLVGAMAKGMARFSKACTVHTAVHYPHFPSQGGLLINEDI